MPIKNLFSNLDPDDLHKAEAKRISELAAIADVRKAREENKLVARRYCQRCFWWRPEKRRDDNFPQEARCAARSSVGCEVRTEYNASCPSFTTRAELLAKAREEAAQ